MAGATGTFVGTPAVTGGRLVLPGGATRTNYVSLPVNIGQEIQLSQAISIEFWFTRDSAQGWSKLFYFGSQNGVPQDDGLEFCPLKGDGTGRSKTEIIIDGQVSAWGGNDSADPSPSYPLHEDHHVVAVFSDAVDRLELYSNGQFSGSRSFSGAFTQLALNALFLGAAVDWSDADYVGTVDEFRIWGAALTPPEILEHYLQGPDQDLDPVVEAQDSPETFALAPAFPNPFNPSTTLSYTLAETSAARLAIYDLAGRQVAVLADGLQAAGTHQLRFDAAGLPAGLYLARLDANGRSETQKLLLVKKNPRTCEIKRGGPAGPPLS